MKQIVLASKSPRRKSLLKQLGLKFMIVPSLVTENLNPRLKPKGQVENLSLIKAEAVVEKFKTKNKEEPKIIISADTVVVLDGEILGKPKDQKEARQMLRKLSGKMHSVFTGFTIIDSSTNKKITRSVETKVYFKKLSEKEIRNYCLLEKLTDKAGAYAIQGIGSVLIEKIEGDYFNVVGLPLQALSLELRKFGVEIL